MSSTNQTRSHVNSYHRSNTTQSISQSSKVNVNKSKIVNSCSNLLLETSSSHSNVNNSLLSLSSSASLSSSTEVCRVAYALNAKKMRKSGASSNSNATSSVIGSELSISTKNRPWKGGGLADILTEEVLDNVSFEAFDFDKPIHQQGFYHIILHKLTEDIRSSDEDSKHKIRAIQQYLKRYPATVMVDSIESVEKVTSRARVCQVIQDILNNLSMIRKSLFRQPKFVIVERHEDLYEKVSSSHLRFPLICKPIEACGTANSHNLVVALNQEGLSLMSCPCIVQEYHDHGANFFKVYVIGSTVKVYRRSSLPDLQRLLLNPDNALNMKSIAFDSRREYPSIDDFLKDKSKLSTMTLSSVSKNDHKGLRSNKRNIQKCNERVVGAKLIADNSLDFDIEDPANRDRFISIAQALSHGFGLTLFGFDVIIPTNYVESFVSEHVLYKKQGDMVVIDVNFFPSYKEVEDFPSRLRQYLRRRAGLSSQNEA